MGRLWPRKLWISLRLLAICGLPMQFIGVGPALGPPPRDHPKHGAQVTSDRHLDGCCWSAVLLLLLLPLALCLRVALRQETAAAGQLHHNGIHVSSRSMRGW